MEEKKITTEKGCVYYWISKKENAQCIIFIHGLTANHTMFDYQIPEFTKNYTVITWDSPMHGKSRPYASFSYKDSAIVLKKLLEKEGISRVILAGQSMGGYICQMFASMYPQDVIGFVGIDTTPFGWKYYSKSDQWWLRQVEWMSRMIPKRILKYSIARTATFTRKGMENMCDMLKVYSKDEICKLMGIAYRSFLDENKDVTFDFPVLLLLGDRDHIGKVKSYCIAWVKDTGYPLKIIETSGHNSNVDNPEAVNVEIENFIRTII